MHKKRTNEERRGSNPEKVEAPRASARRVGAEGWGPEEWGPQRGPDLEKVEAPRAGARRVGARRVGPRSVGARRVGARRREAQNFALFFPLSRSHFRSFSLWGSSRGIFVVYVNSILEVNFKNLKNLISFFFHEKNNIFKTWFWRCVPKGRRGFTRQFESPNMHI